MLYVHVYLSAHHEKNKPRHLTKCVCIVEERDEDSHSFLTSASIPLPGH